MMSRRKGIVYSLITLLLVLPLFLFIITYLDTAGSRDEVTSLKIRGIEISNFANSISQDVPRILRITSKRALISALNEVDLNGTPLDDAQLRIRELMLNGTIYGSESSFMDASSLQNWAERMQVRGSRLGLNTNISVTYLNVTPYDSFNLEFVMLLEVNASDTVGTVSIFRTYNQSYIIRLSLEGLEDSLYPLNTLGFVKRNIAEANFSVYGSWGVDEAIRQEVYVNSSEGGSYLDRMEGKTHLQAKYASQSPRQIGLEGFVNLQKLGEMGITIKGNQTNLDYLYFNETVSDGCTVTNSSFSWLKLDSTTANRYNVSISCP